MAEKSVSISEDNDPRLQHARRVRDEAQLAYEQLVREVERTRPPVPQPQLRVTRTIVVEGTRDWVEQTLARSLHQQAGSTYPAGSGVVRCTTRTDEEIHD